MTRTLPQWSARPPISAAMLNPAFVAAILAWSAVRHQDVHERPLPWPYAFVIVPLVIHKPTREALPARRSAHFANWVDGNQRVTLGFGARAASLAPNVREGIRFGLRTGALEFAEGAGLTAQLPRTLNLGFDSEVREVLQAAALTGAWLPGSGSPAHVFTLLGVAP
jgi:hypothetical protein